MFAMTSEHIDEDLHKNGDSRNVIDQYKNWKVDSIKEDLSLTSFPIHIAIENYQHDYNIGTIVRSANAFHVSGVHIIGKRHWNRRGAMATEKYLELYHHASVEEFKTWIEQNKLIPIGIDNVPGSIPLETASLPTQAILIFGQEGPGLTEEMQSLCKYIVAIEQFGSTRSINVGVAAGIVMYEWVRRNELGT